MREFKIKRYDRERIQKRKQGMRAAAFTVLLGVAALTAGWFAYPPVYQFVTTWEPPSLQPSVPDSPGVSEPEPPSSQPEEPEEEPVGAGIFPARTAYLPPEVMMDDQRLEEELRALPAQGIDGVVFDLKDALGVVQYQSALEQVSYNRAQGENAWSLPQRLNLIRRAGLTPVGRLYAFRDRTSTARMYESAVKYMNSTVNWIDDSQANGGKPWLNPNNQEAQDYILSLVQEAAQNGVGTILLDGVQFPDGVALNLATYGNTGSLDRSAVLAGFLAKARTVGEAEGSHVAVTVNLLSATGLSANRYGEDVGQLLSAAGSGVVEVMPEQFGNGVTSETLTLSSPALDPYKTVSQGLAAAAKALETPAEGEDEEEEEEEERERTLRVPLAAMVQAYTSTTLSQSANKPYGLQEVRDQVRAAEEAGIGAVLYMNPLGDYSALEEQP